MLFIFAAAHTMGAGGDGEAPYDWFKDSLGRYLGYANEVRDSFAKIIHTHDPLTNPSRSQVGESFRPVISALAVRATYGVAGAYVVPNNNCYHCINHTHSHYPC
jgi:hypothetical protein